MPADWLVVSNLLIYTAAALIMKNASFLLNVVLIAATGDDIASIPDTVRMLRRRFVFGLIDMRFHRRLACRSKV